VKLLYFVTLLDSNKNNSKNVQSIINTALLWSIDSVSFNKKDYLNIEKMKKNAKSYTKRNSAVSIYALSRDFQMFPIVCFSTSL